MKKNSAKLGLILIGLLWLTALSPAQAQITGTGSGSGSGATATTTSSLPDYRGKGAEQSIKDFLCTPSDNPNDSKALERCVNRAYRFSISIGAILLVFLIALAGYYYMVGSEPAKKKAKEIIATAVAGMIIILTSFLLLNQINPALTTFRPIQPPIFEGGKLPSCEDVGYGEACALSDGSESVGVGSPGTPTANCPGGVVAINGAVRTASSGTKICKDLLDKLIILQRNTDASPVAWNKNWSVRVVFEGTHESLCHKEGNSKSGTCADIGFGPSQPGNNWAKGVGITNRSAGQQYDWLCSEINKVGGIIIQNEAAANSVAPTCPKYKDYTFSSGAHLHIILAQ
jgi:hypothetical protein